MLKSQPGNSEYQLHPGMGIIECQSLQPAMDGNQGAISQPAGLFPPQQAQFQPQAGFFPTKQKQPADNYAERQESGTHTPDEQVKAGMYKNGHQIDPLKEKLNHL